MSSCSETSSKHTGIDTYMVQATTFLFWQFSQPRRVKSSFHPIPEPGVLIFPEHLLQRAVHRGGRGATQCVCPGEHSHHWANAHSHHQQQHGQAEPTPAGQQPTFQRVKPRNLPHQCPLVSLRTRRPAQSSAAM